MNRQKSGGPGILIRLSNLIVLQVLFIFAALGLILFYPDQEPEVRYNSALIREQIEQVCGQVAERLAGTEAPAAEGPEIVPLAEVTQGPSPISAAALYELRPDDPGQPRPLFHWESGSGSSADGSEATRALGTVDFRVLRYVAAQEDCYILTTTVTPMVSIHYCHIPGDAQSPRVLAAAVDYGVYYASPANERYAFFLLFLCSTLISLLTIYLIVRRLKRPMDRLIHGMEKTAQGELYCLVESDGDRELKRLTDAFNRMAQTLWSNHKALKDSADRLKKSNLSLIDSQIFLATLINSSPLSIIVSAPNGRVVLCNDRATGDFGFEGEQLVGRDITDLLHISSAEFTENLTTLNDRFGCEALCRRSDGTYFPAYVIVNPIQVSGNTPQGYLYITKDITASKDFQEMIIRLDRYCTRGEMAGDIAHEINNYLAILSGNLELLPLLLRKGDAEKIDKKLDLMKGTVDKIVRFANGLMDIPQDEARLEACSLNQIVENVVAFLKPQNRFDGIHLVTSLAPDLPLAHLDPAQVQQLLVNLLFNAADAVADGEGDREIRVTTSLQAGEKGNYGRVEVRDNGTGVPPEKVDSLFRDRFTTKRKGHGIGLITCRKIVEVHGGHIGYRFDNGAVFCFDTPLEARRGERLPEPSRKVPAATPGN
ncbi:MAG TPA: ATP-binding protein [Acidobacteriota bacterium]|nr:ATP-binding protein [Acidobacteriota bacterium]